MNATDCSFTASRAVRFLVAIAAACTALGAGAETYYWIPGNTQGLWTTLGNWSTEGVGGATAASLPSSGDSLYKFGDYNFDLDGGSYTITGWGSSLDGNWVSHYMTIANGSLTITGETRTHTGEINVNSDGVLVFPAGSTFYPGVDGESPMTVKVNARGSMSVLGTARFYRSIYNVAAGGELTFNPTAIRTNSDKVNEINNSGTLNLPSGMTINGVNTSSSTMNLTQAAGILNLGGSINGVGFPGVFNVIFSGGTVNATGDVSFNGTSVSLENSVTFNVDSGKTVDLSPVSFAYGSSVIKAGPGAVILPATAPTATISAGKLALSASTYDLTAVTFEAGSIIELTAMGGRVNSASSSIASATFAATIPATPGTAVLYSTDQSILQKVKTDLNASTPAGFDLVISGESLTVEAETAGAFTVTGNILEATGWGGTIPEAGSDVSIDGAGVIATYSGGTLPAWNSIEVKNGATLRIESDLALPKIILNKNATLAIGNNAVVTLANIADLAGTVATTPDVVVPVLSVESGATLNVPGGMKFSNVNISLAGTLATTTSGGVTFGYANNGETTYIGFAANGGTIAITEGSGDYDLDPIEFCCPETGSAVVSVGDIVLNNASLPKTSGYEYMTGRMVGLHIGRYNREDIAFKVVFNNTKWGTSGKLYICGGASFCLTNNSSFVTYEHHTQWDRYAEISGNASLYVGSGCEFRLNAIGNYGDRKLIVNPSTSGHRAVVVEDGGIFENYRWTGNNNGIFSASNGVYRIFEPYIIENGVLKSVNTPFEGLQSVNIAEKSALTFTTRNQANGHGYFNSGDDRVVSLANVPITGGGSIALSNDNVNVFGVIVTCGENTAAGTAKVIPPASGKGATTLYFADGANWAGTVEAGGFVMTNLVNATAACTNSFGTLNLASGGEVKIRVWKTGDAITTHDGLNVGKYINNGGRITLVQMGEQFVAADKFILGTIDDDSPLPAMSKPWRAERDGEGNLFAKASSGLSVVIR